MNFYDVLAAEKWGGGIPTINFFDLLFTQSMGGGEEWAVYEGTLPATLNANGSDVRQYQVWGNTGGVGDKTVQLFDKNDSDVLIGYEIKKTQISKNSNWFVTGYIPVNGLESYSISNLSSIMLCYDENKNFLYRKESFPINDSNAKFIRMNGLIININTAMLTEGSTALASYVPFGYEVDMVSRTRNLFNKNDSDVLIGYEIKKGNLSPNEQWFVTEYIQVESGVIYSKSRFGASILGYDENKNLIGTISIDPVPNNVKYIRLNALIVNINTAMLTEGSTALPYQPYSNTVTPIYIGDDPLDKDEYIDYQAGKIYRMIDGALTPTNPPVPLPALPTCEGTTIVDFMGRSVAPEKVYLEYQGGKQP